MYLVLRLLLRSRLRLTQISLLSFDRGTFKILVIQIDQINKRVSRHGVSMDNVRVLYHLIFKPDRCRYLLQLLHQLWFIPHVFVVQIKLFGGQRLARINFKFVFFSKLLVFQKKHVSGIHLFHPRFNSIHFA